METLTKIIYPTSPELKTNIEVPIMDNLFLNETENNYNKRNSDN